jgi:hypothetical protein
MSLEPVVKYKSRGNILVPAESSNQSLQQWFSSAATEIFHAFILKCQIFSLRMFKTR